MLLRLICAATVLSVCLPAQTTEVATKETAVTFKSTTNLVSVPVVVRDKNGRAVGTLGREDFQLFDNGKLQSISKFTVENMSVPQQPAVKASEPAAAQTLTPATTAGIPQRYVAFLFDDIHLKNEEMVYVREAGRRRIDAMLPSERAAIYTTSGTKMTDFTADRDLLHKTFDSLRLGSGTARKLQEQNACPPMTYYMGDQIENHSDKAALDVAVTDTLACMHLRVPDDLQLAISIAHSAARVASDMGDRDTLTSLDALRLITSKLAAMPGQRSLVLISPGFLVTSTRLPEETELINRAIRAGVVIGALDARGLYALVPGGDASESTLTIGTLTAKTSYARSEAAQQDDVMAGLAEGTGGTLFKNNNDLNEGLARVAAVPEYIYLLGFSPTALKMDGAYHNLKVSLNGVKGMSLQVRKGYFAANYSADPKEQVRRQLEEAFFSSDEIHDLPATLQTQYFKKDDGSATLSAVATIDVKKLAFRKDGDRNGNEVTIQTGLFDDGGNFVTGLEKIVTLRLLDQTLQTRVDRGIGVKSSFDVHPGGYIVRMVVRDTEGQSIAAQSTRVEIP